MTDYVAPDDVERIILKWPLEAPDQMIPMLPGRVVAVAWQHGNPTLWVEHLLDGPKRNRRFQTHATGAVVPKGRYVGSATSDSLVFHVYEIPA